MIKIKTYLLFIFLLLNALLFAQNNEDLAISYFLQAQEAYGNGNTEAAINSLDYCVETLGKTNPKIEALYIKIKYDDEHNDNGYYFFEIKKHLDKYLKLATSNSPEYEEIIKLAPAIKNLATNYKSYLTKELEDNSKRKWDESGPIYVNSLGYFNENGVRAFESNFGFTNHAQFRDGFAIIKEKKSDESQKMYLIDATGKKYTQALYDVIHRVDKKIYKAIIYSEDYYGLSYYELINTELKKGLKFPNFVCSYIDEFQDNDLAVFKNKKNLTGLINKKGEIIVEAIYEEIGNFNNGLARATGIIDFSGKPVYVERLIRKDGSISFEYKNGFKIGHYNNDGLVKFYNSSNQKGIGYFSKSQILISPQYSQAGEFSDGLAIVKTSSGTGIIDKQNNKIGIIDREFYNTSNNTNSNINIFKDGNSNTGLFHNGKAILQNIKKDAFFVIDDTGKAITEDIKCKSLRFISENTLLFVKNLYPGKYFLFDLNSNIIIDLDSLNKVKINFIYNFNEGYALFSKNNVESYLPDLYGYIDINGNIVVPPIYYGGEPFNEGKAIVYDKYFNEIVVSPSRN
jgi:hypothetical protein